MNKNILETIISKTVFPLYLLEYGSALNTFLLGPLENHPDKFSTTTLHGLYPTIEDAKKAIFEFNHIHLGCLYISIRSAVQYGNLKDSIVEEYLYERGTKYQRIFVNGTHYEYKKIDS